MEKGISTFYRGSASGALASRCHRRACGCEPEKGAYPLFAFEHLVTAAAQLAAMLQLPLETVGSLQSARPQTLARFEQLPATGPRPLGHAA